VTRKCVGVSFQSILQPHKRNDKSNHFHYHPTTATHNKTLTTWDAGKCLPPISLHHPAVLSKTYFPPRTREGNDLRLGYLAPLDSLNALQEHARSRRDPLSLPHPSCPTFILFVSYHLTSAEMDVQIIKGTRLCGVWKMRE